jgi:hypothetical protein
MLPKLLGALTALAALGSLPPAAPATPGGTDPKSVNLRNMVEDYLANEAKADLQYLGKTLTFDGTVSAVRKEPGGKRYYVRLLIKPGHEVRCFFDGPNEVAKLRVSQAEPDRAIVTGRCEGLHSDVLTFASCKLGRPSKAKGK